MFKMVFTFNNPMKAILIIIIGRRHVSQFTYITH